MDHVVSVGVTPRTKQLGMTPRTPLFEGKKPENQKTIISIKKALKGPDWKTPPYYFHKSLRWNFEDLNAQGFYSSNAQELHPHIIFFTLMRRNS